MICPWYKQGYCVSPLLSKPSNTVTSASRCLGDYKSCRYYKDSSDSNSNDGLAKFMKGGKYKITSLMVAEVYAHESPPASQCEYFQVFAYDGKYYARCAIKGQWLTVSQSKLCSLYDKCPYRE